MAIRTILVEDNLQIRDNLIPTMQELAGLEIVAVAETQCEAREVTARLADEWQLLVVDMFLREGSGIGVLRDCMNRRPDQIALVLTNYPTDEIRRRCAEMGADGVFDKSMELEAFFDRCRAMKNQSLEPPSHDKPGPERFDGKDRGK